MASDSQLDKPQSTKANKLMEFARNPNVLAIRGLQVALIDAAIALDNAETGSANARSVVACSDSLMEAAWDAVTALERSHYTPVERDLAARKLREALSATTQAATEHPVLTGDLAVQRAMHDLADRINAAPGSVAAPATEFQKTIDEIDRAKARSAMTRGNYDPNESPEAKAERLAKLAEFVEACNPSAATPPTTARLDSPLTPLGTQIAGICWGWWLDELESHYGAIVRDTVDNHEYRNTFYDAIALAFQESSKASPSATERKEITLDLIKKHGLSLNAQLDGTWEATWFDPHSDREERILGFSLEDAVAECAKVVDMGKQNV